MKKFKYTPEINSISFSNGKKEWNKRFPSNPIRIHESEISCGIHQVSGLNILAESTTRFCNTNALSNRDWKVIFQAVIKSSIQYEMDDEELNGCLWLCSTNKTQNSYYNKINSALEPLSSETTRIRRNPNSGNGIKMWVIPNTSL